MEVHPPGMPISLLRIAGLVLAVILLWLAIRRLRGRGSGSRLPGLVLLATAIGLGVVAAFPDVVRPIQDLLGLEGERWGGVLVCIPAFDEADSLPAVLAEIPSAVAGLPTHVLVIDDGSSDATAAVASAAGAHVVSHPVNSGQGAALQTGYLVAERVGVDVVVTLDADGQHDPGQMHRLVGPIVEGEADFVVGSRRMGDYEKQSTTRDAGITLYTRLINLLGGTQVSDIANGYRAIRASRLAEIAFTEDQFHNPELLLGAARAGLRVVDVPVTIRRRTAGASKKGTNLRYGVGFLRVMLKTWLR